MKQMVPAEDFRERAQTEALANYQGAVLRGLAQASNATVLAHESKNF